MIKTKKRTRLITGKKLLIELENKLKGKAKLPKGETVLSLLGRESSK